MQLGWFSPSPGPGASAGGHAGRRRHNRKVVLLCDSLEGRVTPAHFSFRHHLATVVAAHHHGAHPDHHGATTSTTTSTTSTGSTSGNTGLSSFTTTSSPTTAPTTHRPPSPSGESDGWGGQHTGPSTAVTTALQTLNGDVQTVTQSSGATVGEMATLQADLNALYAAGVRPTSFSALQSFENSLVTTLATNPTTNLSTDTTLSTQFASLFTGTGTGGTTPPTVVTNVYNDLANIVTSAGITSAQITTISNDWSALLAAEGSTSTATYPYFTLATGQGGLGEMPYGFNGFGGFSGDFGNESGSSSAVSTAETTLNGDVQTFVQSSKTTVGDLGTLASDMQAVVAAGYRPTSESALATFQNSLVTSYTSGTAIATDTTLQTQFNKLFTNASTTASTTVLSNAYAALSKAITDSGITSSTITTISKDWSALLTAAGSTSTTTYPYFNLITGQPGGPEGGFGGRFGGFGCGGR